MRRVIRRQRQVPRVAAELAARAGEHRRGLLARDGRRSGRRGGGAAGRCRARPRRSARRSRHMLAARDRQRIGLEDAHAVALGLGVGGEGLGRALERAVDVGGGRAAAAPGRARPGPRPGRRSWLRLHAARAGRPPGRRRSPGSPPRPAPASAPEDALDSVRDDDECVEARVLEQRGALDRRSRLGSARSGELVQGAKAFSTPSSAGASSGWWRSSTSTIVLLLHPAMPSGV